MTTEYDFSQPFTRKRSWKWEHESVVDGLEVIPMSVADTDFVSPREVAQTLAEIVDGGEFGYCSYPDDHRDVFAAWQRRQHGWELDSDRVVIANGLLGSLALMIDAVTAAGEGVIIFTPVYPSFGDVVTGVGRVPVPCDLLCDDNGYWSLDLAAFRALCEQPGCRAVIVCNPHNPVGRAWSSAELRSLIRIARDHDVIVFSDEIHGDFVYDLPFNPAIKAAEDTRGIMTLTSGGKIFNIGGLFASYAITEDDDLKNSLEAALRRIHWEQDTFGAWASYSAYRHGYRYRDEVVGYIRQNQVKLVDALNRMPYPVEASLPEATYLLWADFRGSGWSPDELQRFLVEDAGLGFSRGDSFGAGGAGFARINCAVPESLIDTAIRQLTSAFEKRYR